MISDGATSDFTSVVPEINAENFGDVDVSLC